MSVKDRVIFVPRGPRGPQGEQGEAGDGAATLAPLVEELLKLNTSNFSVFVDAINGNDGNAGTNVNIPVATLQRAIELCRPFGFNYVNLISNITFDYRTVIDNFNGVLYIRGRTDDGSSGQPRKLTVINSTNFSNSRPGCLVVNNNMSIRFESIDIELNTSMGYGLLEISVAYVQALLVNCNITKIGSGSAKIFHTGSGSVGARFNSVNIDASAEGHIFSSVAAGQDPNALFNYFSNLTSA